MSSEICDHIGKLCIHVDLKCGLPKGHTGQHKTLLGWSEV